MSFTLTVTANEPLSVQAVLRATGLTDIACKEELGENWSSEPRHLFRTGLSVRPIGVTQTDGEFAVRILSASNEVDHLLARALVLAAAGISGGDIRPEWGGSFDIPSFSNEFAEDWARTSAHHGPDIIRKLVSSGRGPLTMNGVTRPFVVGDWVLSQLDADDFGASFHRHFHAMQWLDPQVENAGEFVSKGAEPFTLAFWLSDRAVVLPNVDYIVLQDGDDTVSITADAIPKVCPNARRLDDAQWLVPAVPETEWSKFVRHATSFLTPMP